jgi:hypothetical protein
MTTLILLPTNKRAKQLIKEYGDEWEILERRYVQCFEDQGILICSKNNQHTRWVRHSDVIIDEKYT